MTGPVRSGGAARGLRRLAGWGAAWALATAIGLVAARAEAPAPGLGRAPAFTLRTVTGERLELAALLERGPVLLDFWATWCKPCLQSLPELETLHRRHAGGGLTVIGVSIDGPRNHARVRPFARRLGLTFPVALDEGERLQQLFHVRAVPTSILIGRDGTVLHARQGFLPGDTEALDAAIAAALGSGADAPGSPPR